MSDWIDPMLYREPVLNIFHRPSTHALLGAGAIVLVAAIIVGIIVFAPIHWPSNDRRDD
jgi:hypothetical protein